MSKYKGNYGNSRANAAASTTTTDSSLDLSSLIDLLDSYGFDLPAMLLLFWLLLFFIVVGGVNLYLALVRRRQQQSVSASSANDQKKAEIESEITASSSVKLQQGSSPKTEQQYADEEDEENRRWIDKVISWLYSVDVGPSVDTWLGSLNSKSAKLTAENGIHLEFVRLYRDKSSAIRFTDVNVKSEVNGNIMSTVKAICDRLVIAVRVHQASTTSSREISSSKQSALYDIELNKFSALLKVVCKPEDSLFIVRFLERPETKVHINGPLTSSEQNGFSPDLIINGVLNVLTSTLVDLSFAEADRFPARHTFSSSTRTFNGNSHELAFGSPGRRSLERKLFVTIARAHNLPVNQAKGHEVYCTIEMNEPNEKRQTSSIREDASAPVWQDHFLFALSEESREIHFEVFDAFQEKNRQASGDVSLGYGVANLNELKLSPSEKLTIPLQSRRNGFHGGNLEVELLLMEHNVDDDQLNLPEKSEYQKVPVELAAYQRDHLSSTTFSSSSSMSSSSGFTFDSQCLSASNSSLLTSTTSTTNTSSGPGSGSSSGGSPKGTWRFTRLAKIASLGSLFSNFSLNSGSSTDSQHKRRPNRHPSLPYSSVSSQNQQQQQYYPQHRLSYPYQTASSSLAMSLPVISPLIEVRKRGSYPRDEQINGTAVYPQHVVPPIFVTQANQGVKTSPPGRKQSSSLRWLRGNSLRTKKQSGIELPPTVLYPVEQGCQSKKADFSSNQCQQRIQGGSLEIENNSLAPTFAHPPLRPSLTLSHLENFLNGNDKRSSVYSQLSFDSIDSRLSLVDDSAFEEPDTADSVFSPGGVRRKGGRLLPLPTTITLPQSSEVAPSEDDFSNKTSHQNQQLYGRYAEKAKSDTHLYFTLDETSTEEALRENYENQNSRRQFFFGDDDLLTEEDDTGEANKSIPPITPLKRNSNRRTSLYAKFISAKRATTKAVSSSSTSPSSTVNSVKQRFRFRSSSKLPARLAGSTNKSDSNRRSSESKGPDQEQSSGGGGRLGSLVSASSVNLSSSGRRDSASAVRVLKNENQTAAFRRRSYKSATEMNSFMQRAHSSILPLANNHSANSTSSHLDNYARSSLNTIKSDDHGQSSEGYGTDRGVTPDVPSSAGTLPPTRPESRSSQPRERSLIRTIRKRLSFTKRSKSVERQPASSSSAGTSFRESSVGGGSNGGTIDNRDERARSVPGSREPSAPRDNLANGKKQESFLSLASNTSFFAENSTLVLECTVNGEKKHYIVPYSKANKRKYRRRKGIKLHVFNDHLFVAQHVSSSQECQVCTKTFPMRIGKQGYVCRECGFLTHKLCHVNVESFCPANGAARLNFEVEGEGGADTPKQMPSPVPEVRVIAPNEPFNEKEVF